MSRHNSKLWTQTAALCRKNWIVIWRHKWWNLFRCLIIPILYTSYVAQTIQFFKDTGTRGEGHIATIPQPPSDLLDSKLVAYDPTGSGIDLLKTALANSGVNTNLPIEELGSPQDLITSCTTNLNGRSNCYGAIFFENVDRNSGLLNYTIRGDSGLNVVNVDDWKNDDFMRRFLPLQWAIDSTWMNETTGTMPERPMGWIFTNLDEKAYDEKVRNDFMNSMRGALVISYVVNFLFIVYHLPGYVAMERANGLTEMLEAMGCSTLARLLSWHLSISAAHLPSWIAMAGIYRAATFKHTNAGFLIVAYIVIGLSLASWTFIIAVPFAKKPTLSAIASVGVCIIGAVIGMIVNSNAGAQIVLTIIFPSSLIVFVHRSAASFDLNHMAFSWTKKSPHGDAPMVALIILGIVNIFLWPVLAVYLERAIYGLPSTHGTSRSIFAFKRKHHEDVPPGVAVRVDHLRKEYVSKQFYCFGREKSVVAIEDLSFDIPRGGIFCLLGRNGAAKSTTLSAISGLTKVTSGSVRYADDLRMGFASQKDVLWDDLNCVEHVRLWRAIKGLDGRKDVALDRDLVERCDLTKKRDALSKTLSGGQKRKLQLACAIAGNSNLLLLDEISSGLDPLSRRAIWKVISSYRGTATIVLTTHFLDEADYLGDNIAILQAPGRLLAVDSPVALKTDLGRGFFVTITDAPGVDPLQVLQELQKLEPNVTMRSSKGKHVFGTGSNSVGHVRQLAHAIENMRRSNRHLEYQIGSTTIEEVFLDLNSGDDDDTLGKPRIGSGTSRTVSAAQSTMEDGYKGDDIEMQLTPSREKQLCLTPGEPRVWWRSGAEMIATVVHKRWLVFRRSWLIPVAAVVGVTLAATIPLVFMDGRSPSCAFVVQTEEGFRPLTYPQSLFRNGSFTPLVSTGDAQLGNWLNSVDPVTTVDGNTSFVDTVREQWRDLHYGGVSLTGLSSLGGAIVAYEGDPSERIMQVRGLSALNLYSNSVYQQLSPNTNAFRIAINYEVIPFPDFSPTGKVLLWITFFGMVMAIWPAFAAIYPSTEKTSGVRVNQYSNGARPAALWAGHLLYEIPGILLVATIVTVACAAVGQFEALGQFWVCLVLYGISATCYAFFFSLLFKTSFGSWAAVAMINGIVFLFYVVVYQVIQVTDKTDKADRTMFIAHVGYAVLHPVVSLVRAAFVSVNVFNLLCDGKGNRTTKDFSDITLFGAPVIYMIVQGVIAFALLVWMDSGRPMPWWLRPSQIFSSRKFKGVSDTNRGADVLDEKARVESSGCNDALVTERLTKRFGKRVKPSVDDVSFGVAQGDTFALIGPNGAGKTTTLGCIRGVVEPTRGDVRVMGHSIVRARNVASLGVCPQHSAIDMHLTVYQHLWLYGRLKGVPRWALGRDVDALLAVSGLSGKANELAASLSGGNQRKLSLAIALIGDRPVILIDEFSSGVDPFSKREAWNTLETLTQERAVVMTTHSMEEVDALANRVGIIASKLLALGTPASLKSRFATYEVHLRAEDVQPMLEYLWERGFSDAQAAQDTLTRIAVPGVREGELDTLLGVLQGAERDIGITNMTLHEASTEAAFLAIVRENNVKEDNADDDEEKTKKKRWWHRKRKQAD